MQKIKLKDYLLAMTIKLYNLEVLVDDLVYVGSEIRAKSQEDAIRILGIISNGEVTEDSEVLSCEEKTLH
jgi:cytochrome c-type biogenesis protein CcmE